MSNARRTSFVKYAVVIFFGLLATAMLGAGPANDSATMKKAARLTSSFAYSDTASSPESALKNKGFTFFATIDYRVIASVIMTP